MRLKSRELDSTCVFKEATGARMLILKPAKAVLRWPLLLLRTPGMRGSSSLSVTGSRETGNRWAPNWKAWSQEAGNRWAPLWKAWSQDRKQESSLMESLITSGRKQVSLFLLAGSQEVGNRASPQKSNLMELRLPWAAACRSCTWLLPGSTSCPCCPCSCPVHFPFMSTLSMFMSGA